MQRDPKGAPRLLGNDTGFGGDLQLNDFPKSTRQMAEQIVPQSEAARLLCE